MSVEALLPSASPLRELHLSVVVDEDLNDIARQRIEYVRPIALSDTRTLNDLANPEEGLQFIRARLEDLIHLASLPSQASISPRSLFAVVSWRISSPSIEFWTMLCHSLEHLCFLKLQNRRQLAREPHMDAFLDPMLRGAATTLSCLELHTSSSCLESNGELPVLSKLRTNLLGPTGYHRWTGPRLECPSLLFLDVPTSLSD